MSLTINTACDEGDISITTNDQGVEVKWSNTLEKISFTHSFHDPAQFYNRIMPTSQGLLKACNNKQRSIHTLLDLTGGWGLDSFILAQHGKQVTMLEQNQSLNTVISHSLDLAGRQSHTRAAASRIQLITANSAEFLRSLDDSNAFDCIYLDPMFPVHKSGAKPGKEMQILQKLTENLDIETCFELALEKALKRVVVKRPAKSSPVSDKNPDMTYREKTIRFDVYLTA